MTGTSSTVAVGHLDAAESRGNGVQLEPVDALAGVIARLDPGRHVEPSRANGDLGVDPVARRHREAGPVDRARHDRGHGGPRRRLGLRGRNRRRLDRGLGGRPAEGATDGTAAGSVVGAIDGSWVGATIGASVGGAGAASVGSGSVAGPSLGASGASVIAATAWVAAGRTPVGLDAPTYATTTSMAATSSTTTPVGMPRTSAERQPEECKARIVDHT